MLTYTLKITLYYISHYDYTMRLLLHNVYIKQINKDKNLGYKIVITRRQS